MTQKHILSRKSSIHDTAHHPHAPDAEQADKAKEIGAAPVSVLSTAELRQIVMQILG